MKFFLITLIVFLNLVFSVHAQTEVQNDDSQTVGPEAVVSNDLTRLQRLEGLAQTINSETEELNDLRALLNESPDDTSLQNQVDQRTAQLDSIRQSFEQLAINNIDTEVFEEVEEPATWQEELLLVVKPLLENLRGLTEEPRRREELRQEIISQTGAIETAGEALSSIEEISNNETLDAETRQTLESVRTKWQRLLTDSQRKLDFADTSLGLLNQNDVHWFDTFKASLQSFAKDRGLTLVIATAVAFLIFYFFSSLTKLIESRRKKKSSLIKPTSYRIVVYSQRLLTFLFIIIGVMVVFFMRGDVLLMALMWVLIFVSVLALKNLIPNFLQESRILLNIGRVRENELVNYNGIPWRVAALNVSSKLVNPELKGILRLPLEELKELTSRPISDEKWFPSSIGDWVLDNDKDRIYEVIGQGPDAVEIQSAQGTNKLIPTGDYYSAGFVNLTKSKKLRITSVFGVDYNLQSICLDEIPEKMQKQVQTYLEGCGLDSEEIRTQVEFSCANSSSLDYKIIVHVSSKAAPDFYRIERYIQQACVQLCNKEGWGIPFPQLTLSGSVQDDKQK